MPQKPTRIKNLKFNTFEELMEHYEDNPLEVHIHTLNRLNDYFTKYNKVAQIDVFKVNVSDAPEIRYMSILEDEWEHALFDIETFFVSMDMFEDAAIVRDLSWKIFGKVEL